MTENSENPRTNQIYCPECGTENKDDSRFCMKCGAPLKVGVSSRYRRRNEKYEKYEKREKNEKDEKAGLEKTEVSRNWIVLGGCLVIFTGIISLLDVWYGYGWASWDRLWTVIPIIVGLFIIWNALKAKERSPRP